MIVILANVAVLITALLHAWFCILQMFFWTKPLGLKTFKINQAYAQESSRLAANQGLYNGFLSAGLFWGLFSTEPLLALSVKIFFLSCVAIAGLYAGFTVNKRILFIQGIPAIVALILVSIDNSTMLSINH